MILSGNSNHTGKTVYNKVFMNILLHMKET